MSFELVFENVTFFFSSTYFISLSSSPNTWESLSISSVFISIILSASSVKLTVFLKELFEDIEDGLKGGGEEGIFFTSSFLSNFFDVLLLGLGLPSTFGRVAFLLLGTSNSIFEDRFTEVTGCSISIEFTNSFNLGNKADISSLKLPRFFINLACLGTNLDLHSGQVFECLIADFMHS
eukprot:NODE_241_length_11910_cov_1.082381.p9 type:complete len:178 gc:universal NODE_241_length_11910_cov_1.082381:2038-1505(-)